MRTVLQFTLLNIGLDPKVYRIHSLRISRSSDLLNYGVSVETIKKLGQWRSNVVFKYLILISFSFPDNIETYHDVWILGDAFLKEAVNALRALENAGKANSKAKTYLYQQYNVKTYYNVNSSASKGVAHLLNPLLEALNDRARLPKYIIMIPDKDLIVESKSYGFGASYILGSAIYFIIRQTEMLLSRRRIDLTDKNPGALINDKYLQIIWIHMLKRPSRISLLGQGKALALRGRFNAILEERSFEGPSNLRLMSIEVNENDFDFTGYLTSSGKSNILERNRSWFQEI